VKRILLSFCLLTNVCLVALSQEESQGQIGINPPSIHWRQIQTPTGKVIFPEGLDSVAARVAGIMSYEKNHDLSIIGAGTTRQVPVILQNLSTLPAGFSTPAPWRNEYFLTPPQNFFAGAVPWLDILTAHEYRHAQQFSAANTGFTRAYQVLMGQTGWLFNSVLTQPLWYREGDAVTNETIFTNAGRGRLPAFHMEYRAMRLSGYHYNYEKAHFSSLKDFIPNPYRTGYYMVTKARRDYGEDIWKNVLTDTYGKTWIFYPFSRSLKKFTGNGTKAFYNATVTELDSIFENTDKTLQPTASREVFTEESKIYTNWRFPHYLADGTVVSLRNSFNEIQTYYQIDNDGKRHHLFSPGFIRMITGRLLWQVI
jgi:hypothetical protein